MKKEDIIKENIRRLGEISAAYNPVTGEGSVSVERQWTRFEGFPIERINLPAAMLKDEKIAQLAELGAEGYITGVMGKEANDRTIIRLWLEFCLTRIKHDFEYWARTMTTIADKGKGRDTPFTLNRPQRIYLKALESLRKRNWNSVICGDIEKQSSIVAGMLAKVINRYPAWATGGRRVTTAPYQGAQKTRVISWSNSRYSLGSAQRPDSLRSEDISMAHLTEVGLWKTTQGRKPEDLVQSIFGSISSGPYTMKVIESTAKGVGNFFHRTWIDAVGERNNFTPVFIPWFAIDLYSTPLAQDEYPGFVESMNEYEQHLFSLGATLEAIAWYRSKRREMPDEWRLFSEFPSTPEEAFQSTGRRVFKIPYVDSMRKNCVPPLFVGDIVYKEGESGTKGKCELVAAQAGEKEGNCLSVWLMPDEENLLRDRYIVTVDVGGTGSKADYSCIVVADRIAMADGGVPEIAACWHGHIEHDRLAWKAVEIARAYGNALLVIEANTLETEGTEGNNFEYILNEIAGHYSNLYCRTSQTEIRQGRPRRWGFHTNSSTKPMVINFLIKALRDSLYIERCLETTYELDLYEFKENGKEMGAIEGNHDDRVMATAILVWTCYNHPLPARVTGSTGNRRNRIISEASI